MKAIININRHVIAANNKSGRADPPITVKARGKNVYASEVVVTGTVRILYRPDAPLGCGATAWLCVDGDIEFVGETMSFQELTAACQRGSG